MSERPTLPAHDGRLSLRAYGLLALLLAEPEQRSDAVSIAERVPEGRDAIRRATRELEAAGYLARERVKDDSGRFAPRHVTTNR